MKYAKAILFAVGILFGFNSFSQEQVDPRVYQMPAQWLKLEEGRYTIDHPITWIQDVSGDAGTTFFIHTPLCDAEDSFTDNINLIEQHVGPQENTLDAYVEMSVKNIPVFFSNSNLLKKEKKKLNKREMYMLEYTGDLNGFSLHFIQHIYMIEGKAVILTFTAQPRDFDYFKEAAVKVMNSLKINS